MNLQKDVQKIVILVMRYTNVSTKFHYLNVENKIKHFNNFKHKIDCEYIHYFVGSETIIYKKNSYSIYSRIQISHNVIFS